MIERALQLYFKVVSTYEEHNHLILVGDTTDCALSKNIEDVTIKRSGLPDLTARASLLKFAGGDPGVRAPVCLAVKNLTPSDVSIGAEVWKLEPLRGLINHRKFERM